MDQRWKTRVHSILHDLIEVLMPLTFLSRLLAEELITAKEYERLSLDSVDDEKRSGTLLVSILPKRGPHSFDRFLNVLRKTKGQEHVAQMIEETERYDRTELSLKSEEKIKKLEKELKKERREKIQERVTNIGLRTKIGLSMRIPNSKWETSIPNMPIDCAPYGRVAEINGILHVGQGNRMFQLKKGAWEGEKHRLPGIQFIWSVLECEGKGYVMNISDRYQCASIYEWKSEKRDLELLSKIPREHQLAGRSAIGHNGKIYLVGGWRSDRVDCFDISKEKWKPIKKMKNVRWECSSAVIDDKMFVGGGGWGMGNSVECFSMEKQEWIDVKPTTKNWCEFSSWNGKLVATGGRGCSKCVEMYDELSGDWLPLPSMNEGRYAHGTCTTEENQLIVVGGSDALNSVECLKI